ncbi:unnamed protein product [Protopolystoma xenopodis]|uniref:3-hydroxyisobutyryl-CoA hydrolase, mitochondrial n=1 Tax=Protopolystoma xenopodis TaxID=117903 RepID=A0A3S5A610_9PLAT|nr:unnamed protein product [Protopolystoma xenopodis]
MASGPEVLVKELDVLAKSDLGSASIWAQKQLEMLRKSSPTSLKITVRQLTEGSKMSFTDVFRMEFRLSSRCARGHDFPEGVKALLKDKGRSPNWRPESLEAVTNSDIETYFAPLPTEQEWHP